MTIERDGARSIVFGSLPAGVSAAGRQAAYAVIRDEKGRVAVVAGEGGWFLPGGGGLAGETPPETLQREVREECGRSVRVVEDLGTAVQYFHSASDACWYEMLATFYRAEFEGEAEGRAEHELQWVDPAGEARGFFHACHAWAASRSRRDGTGPRIVGVDHVQLAMPAGEEDRARAFYSDLLGLPEIPKPAELARRGGAWFESAHVKIHLGVDAEFRAARKAHPGLLVEGLPALAARLRAAGYQVLDDPMDGRPRVYVNDPFGNRLELLESTR